LSQPKHGEVPKRSDNARPALQLMTTTKTATFEANWQLRCNLEALWIWLDISPSVPRVMWSIRD